MIYRVTVQLVKVMSHSGEVVVGLDDIMDNGLNVYLPVHYHEQSVSVPTYKGTVSTFSHYIRLTYNF